MSQKTFSRRRFLTLSAGMAGLGAAGFAALYSRAGAGTGLSQEGQNELRSFNRTSWALGADVSLTVLHKNEQDASNAVDAAFAELNDIENSLSIYRPTSQVSRLNRDGVLNAPDRHFTSVMSASLEMSKLSDGAFDVTVQPLWDIYFAAKKLNTIPENSAIEAGRSKVDWSKIEFAPERVAFKQPGMKITFNGIAQGYAADRVAAVLKSHGIEHALVDAGEFQTVGRKADGSAFKCGIQHPRKPDELAAVCAMDGRALATSGDYATTFSDDFIYNHIFNPATGRSPLDLASVSVVAPTCMIADALTKPVFILGREKGLSFVSSIAKCDAWLIGKDGVSKGTPGFPMVS